MKGLIYGWLTKLKKIQLEWSLEEILKSLLSANLVQI